MNFLRSRACRTGFFSKRLQFQKLAVRTFANGTPLTETVRTFLDPKGFHECLTANGFDFYTGVPDSLLKDFCAYISDTVPAHKHVIAANEGTAVGIASGFHLATGKYPVVYLQNSGLGNIVNPIMSLATTKVYNIPMMILIGWRGEPGKRDEPQHMVQGKIMPNLLTDMNIPFEVLPDYLDGAVECLETCRHHLKTRGGPFAFLVKRQTFSKYELVNKVETPYSMTREDAITEIAKLLGDWDPIISTTGFASRELYELRDRLGQDHSREFLTVGSMGHASAIGLGVALSKPSKEIVILDGDGACIMHMGNMMTIGSRAPKNLTHILLNNGAHDSVGGQETGAFGCDFVGVAKSLGYKTVIKVEKREEIKAAIAKMRESPGPAFIEVRCNIGARTDLGRPKTTPSENKEAFMHFLQN